MGEEVEKNTCIRFLDGDKQKFHHDVFVKKNSATGLKCSSGTGMSTLEEDKGSREISLTSKCLTEFGTMLHELMHMLGFMHEQQRPDRDEYVWLGKEGRTGTKICQETNVQYRKYGEDEAYTLPTPYDYCSCTHYIFKSSGQPCILLREPADRKIDCWYWNGPVENGDKKHITSKNRKKVGQRLGFSESDIKDINAIYCS